MKKFVQILICAMLVMALTVPAFAVVPYYSFTTATAKYAAHTLATANDEFYDDLCVYSSDSIQTFDEEELETLPPQLLVLNNKVVGAFYFYEMFLPNSNLFIIEKVEDPAVYMRSQFSRAPEIGFSANDDSQVLCYSDKPFFRDFSCFDGKLNYDNVLGAWHVGINILTLKKQIGLLNKEKRQVAIWQLTPYGFRLCNELLDIQVDDDAEGVNSLEELAKYLAIAKYQKAKAGANKAKDTYPTLYLSFDGEGNPVVSPRPSRVSFVNMDSEHAWGTQRKIGFNIYGIKVTFNFGWKCKNCGKVTMEDPKQPHHPPHDDTLIEIRKAT